MTVWYTSDTHFGHRLVAIEKRGFASMEEHDETIIANWNSVVKFTDIVYLLGDVAMNWKGAEEKIARLNGVIHLITGNHDPMFPGNRDSHKHQAKWIGTGKFDSIQAYARRKVNGREFLLSHFPYQGDHVGTERYTQYRLRDEGMWLVHGHTHQQYRLGEDIVRTLRPLPFLREQGDDQDPWRWRNRQLHAGLDAWDLHPVCEDEVMKLMDSVDTRFPAVV